MCNCECDADERIGAGFTLWLVDEKMVSGVCERVLDGVSRRALRQYGSESTTRRAGMRSTLESIDVQGSASIITTRGH